MNKEDPWDQKFYPKGTSAFDRMIFFSDAVFAIALTLVAVGIGLPMVKDAGSIPELLHALLVLWPKLVAYAFTFMWIAFYWRANHKFTVALKGMNARYITVELLYLAFIALLPLPAATLGEYTVNPVALSFFSVWVAIVSTLEVVLILVADHHDLYICPLTKTEKRQKVIASLTPVASFLAFAILVFVSIPLAIVLWIIMAVFMTIASRRKSE
ncbi:MAG: DUF1211 domain-containing protein [Candidatus Cloacimonetes bacterium]|nr:DUF1211 domain-containing protein [Candidatus Cloacimonadota bacterium]